MVLNYIWIAFFLIAFVTALMRLVFLGDTQVFPEIINSTFNSSKTAFEISLGLTGVLSLWLGIMRIGEQGGVITLFSRLLGPLFSKLFPDIPKGHPVTGSIFMNLAANMLGLDNAARINKPSTVGQNWRWRLKKTQLTKKLQKEICQLTTRYGRKNWA